VHQRTSSGARPAPAAQTAPGHGRLELPGVGALVAVASGKGGVGKSTIAANLACALARQGKRVGLMDADVYGPSAPILFGLEGEKPRLDDDKRVIPLEAFGVKVMSVGFIAASEQAMIWRGPIVTSTISELLGRVTWAPLDVLVIDLPPGTGDVQITLSQRAPLSGAVIVSTPQKLALADVRRGVEMFRKVHVPILGVVENMSAATDPETGAVFAPFGMDGARLAAEALGAPFLGAFPLDPSLAFASDHGEPPAAVAPESEMGARFAALAAAVLGALAAGPGRPAPEIVFE
jgi:ATP-binding protein involved in chromosome partitioning